MGVIYLDACLVIYLTEEHARWGGPVADAMRRAGQARFAISPLVKCECLVAPISVAIRSWSAPISSCSGFSCHWPCPSRCTCKPHSCVRALLFGHPTPSTWLALSTIAARRCGLAQASHGLARNVLR